MPDLTLDILKDIRAELRELKTDVRELKTDVRGIRTEMTAGFEILAAAIIAGFTETERRLDAVVDVAGHHHAALETRVARIEEHLKLAR